MLTRPSRLASPRMSMASSAEAGALAWRMTATMTHEAWRMDPSALQMTLRNAYDPDARLPRLRYPASTSGEPGSSRTSRKRPALLVQHPEQRGRERRLDRALGPEYARGQRQPVRVED